MPANERIRAGWPVWRLVLEGVATLDAIEASWSIERVLDANEAIDWRADCDQAWTLALRELDAPPGR